MNRSEWNGNVFRCGVVEKEGGFEIVVGLKGVGFMGAIHVVRTH